MKLYQSKVYEIRTYEGWRAWYETFYASSTEDGSAIPKDWFERVTKVLKLEEYNNEKI